MLVISVDCLKCGGGWDEESIKNKICKYIVVRHELISILIFFSGGGGRLLEMMLVYLLEVLKHTIFVYGFNTYTTYSTIILLL